MTRTLKTFGISEGGLDEMIAPLFESTNPSLGIYSKSDGIHLRAIANATTEKEAREMIAPMEAQIRETAGDAIWGEDDETPETQLAAVLLKRRQTLGIMESFTGGLLASNLSEVHGNRDFLKGSVVSQGNDVLEGYGVDPLLIEQFGPAGAEVAQAMAQAARRSFNSDVGLAVTGVVTEPTESSGPVGAIYTGFALDNLVDSALRRCPARRLRTRSRAATDTLLQLIQFLNLS